MSSKDPEVRRATSRAHYARHREEVIAAVKHRKKTAYAGVCRNCGGPTIGSSKKTIPEWCGKPECKSAQHKQDPDYIAKFVESGLLGRRLQQTTRRWVTPKHAKKTHVSLDEILGEIDEENQRRKRKSG